MVNKDMDRSWFHGADHRLLEKFQRHWRFPCFSVPPEVTKYHLEFEKGLKRAMELGDSRMVPVSEIFEYLKITARWCEERCRAAGLKLHSRCGSRDVRR